MAGLVPAIHAAMKCAGGVDARRKAEHDGIDTRLALFAQIA
jgi:hypothetical protein